MELAVEKYCRGDDTKRQEKAKFLMSVLIMQPEYKTRLVSGREKPQKMVQRKKEDFDLHAEINKEKEVRIG